MLMIWNVKIARILYWNIDEETIKLDYNMEIEVD